MIKVKKRKILLLPGDGIGPEVIGEVKKIINWFNNKKSLDYTYNLNEKQTGITNLLQDIKDSGLKLRDLKTEQSNLEKIFVTLVRENNEN